MRPPARRSPLRGSRFRDLVREAFRGEVGPDVGEVNWRRGTLAWVRRELEVLEAEIDRGWSEDEAISRAALARAVRLLEEIDRNHYRET